MAKLRHIAINCDDLEAAAKFYSCATTSGFVVDDVEAAVAKVESYGAVAMSDPTAAGAGATWETKMLAPDGVAFDLTAHGWPGISV